MVSLSTDFTASCFNWKACQNGPLSYPRIFLLGVCKICALKKYVFFLVNWRAHFFTPKNLRSRYLWVALIWIFNSGHEFLKSRHLLTYWWGSHPTGSFGNSQKKWCQHAKHLSGFVEQTRAAYKQHQPPASQNWWNRTFVWWWRKMKKEIKKAAAKEFFDTCTLQLNESCEECLKMNQDCWDTKDSPLHIWFQGGLPF